MATVTYDNASRIHPGSTRPAVDVKPHPDKHHAFHAVTGKRL
jgi:hypothetical protein